MRQDAKAIVLIMYTLIAIGVVMIYSASAVYADQVFQNPTFFLKRQSVFILIGTFAFLFTASLDPDVLRRHSRIFMLIALALLSAVFLPVLGRSAGGARRWLQLPFVSFQPVEYAKLAVCIYLSDYLSRKTKPIMKGSILVFLAPSILLFLMFFLIMAQPDLGSCIFLFLLVGTLFFLSGMRFRFIFLAALILIVIVTFFILAAPYRMRRITAFLDPWKDPQGSGFQIIQSFVAFGLGGIKGVGLGQSTQKLFYLPESYTDFIFSIVGEELGLMGAVAIVACYGAFFLFGCRIVHHCREPFMRLLSQSLVLLVTLQALINILVTIGLVPTKGLPLPFVSYGGTALIFHMIAVGVLIAVDIRSIRMLRR